MDGRVSVLTIAIDQTHADEAERETTPGSVRTRLHRNQPPCRRAGQIDIGVVIIDSTITVVVPAIADPDTGRTSR